MLPIPRAFYLIKISFSPWHWDQTSIKLGTKHVTYINLAIFTWKTKKQKRLC